MSVSINISELKETLELTPSTQNIMLVGKHGIGKSEILTSFFNEKGLKVVTLFLGQMADPGDIIGIPSKVEKQDAAGKATARTDFTPPYWFPQDGQPIVLFLDELNRARPEILQTVMDLTLNRKLAGKALPEGSHVISAVNEGEEYQLTDLDPALVSRFNIYEFKPTVEEWLNWAAGQKLDERVVNFIQDNPTWLDGDRPSCVEACLRHPAQGGHHQGHPQAHHRRHRGRRCSRRLHPECPAAQGHHGQRPPVEV